MDVLSGGEKQRMAVSSTLLLNSLSVLFCSVCPCSVAATFRVNFFCTSLCPHEVNPHFQIRESQRGRR